MLSRISFALRHRTLRRAVVDPSDDNRIIVCCSHGEVRMKRRCPHQGAPLEDAYFKGDTLICQWHGCRFKLGQKDQPD
ncbi:MAG: Rieske 2Fe-2S domain-containing protein [Opitutales bacterium]|jgi:nitrite reductase/ring-hydroxylating ferredoxin subunit